VLLIGTLHNIAHHIKIDSVNAEAIQH
jgi:hypothetical protein